MPQVAQLAAELDTLRQRINQMLPDVINEAITIQQIAAPTFHEGERAAYVQGRFTEMGHLDSIEIAKLHNVYARFPGTNPSLPAVMIAAHTDTVFDAETKLDTQRQESRIYGPGIGDNSMGVAGLLILAQLVRGLKFPMDVWFVANSREEGMGDLGGIRTAYEKLHSQLGTAIIIEGMAYGRIYHAGIAVRRLKISCTTPGGHSWLHFGKPSAIHCLMQMGAQISMMDVPTSPRTTYNIGVIEGGQSVNSIAASASMLLDLRSERHDALMLIENRVMDLVTRQRGADINVSVEVVGDRPSGMIPLSHPLVMWARDVLQYLGTQPIYEIGSTDANIPLAAGLPTITVGITYGGNAHRLDEYIETSAIRDGLWQLVLLMAGIANGATGFSLP